eukprot:scaffold1486_cov314-Pavlova_lutheri.AAC.13
MRVRTWKVRSLLRGNAAEPLNNPIHCTQHGLQGKCSSAQHSYSHRTMVAANGVLQNVGIVHSAFELWAHQKVIDAPTHVALSCTESIAPVRVPPYLWMLLSKYIPQAATQQQGERAALLVREPC